MTIVNIEYMYIVCMYIYIYIYIYIYMYFTVSNIIYCERIR